MCFPNKRQKDNFTDTTTTNTTKAQTSASQKSPTPVLPPVVSSTEKHNGTMSSSSQPKVAIIIYSMYGHIAKLAEAVKVGVERAGGAATIFQVAETLSDEILAKMSAPPKANYPIMTLEEFVKWDAYIFGIPTRYGTMTGQWKAFWDSTPKLWGEGALYGKYAGIFFSTAGPGGGQETTALTTIPCLTHHGIIFVPLGYAKCFNQLTTTEEVHGGSPWGCGTFSKSDQTRQPTALELDVANIQGENFWKTVSRVKF